MLGASRAEDLTAEGSHKGCPWPPLFKSQAEPLAKASF